MVARNSSRRWTREEAIIVFNLYCRIPFKDSNKSHPDVRRFAEIVGRTPSAVNMKIGNFGSLDPELKRRGISGLGNVTRLDRQVWDEFHQDWEALIDESDALIAARERELASPSESDEPVKQVGNERDSEESALQLGKERDVVRKARQNQAFFRNAIISAYDGRCCVTGIDVEPLLIASHIKPWARSDGAEKLNPRNGLCLNALHDRAFDRGLITLADDFTILVSRQIAGSANGAVQAMLLGYSGKRIRLPDRFVPRGDFIAWHRDNVFRG